MKNLLIELETILKTDQTFIDSDGKIIKGKVQEEAINLNPRLIRLLLTNNETKKAFFTEIEEVLVFDKVKFSWVLSNREFLPDSYTRFKNRIGLVDSNESFISSKDDVVIAFPNKDCLLEFDSTKESEQRPEVFFNEVLNKNAIDVLLDKKVISKYKKHTSNNQKNSDNLISDNMIIKGNNLIALYSLLPKYKGQIKLMYWDILYNTNNDVVPYNDSIKHSSWLTMMKNRLSIVEKLLCDGGTIVIQCDDNEQPYLKVLCDEVLGRDNFVNTICIKMSDASGPKMAHIEKRFPKVKEYLLIYRNGQIKINVVREEKNNWDSEYKNFIDIDENQMKYYLHSATKDDFESINKDLESKLITLEEAYSKYKPVDKQKFLKNNSWRIARTSNSSTIKKFIEQNQINGRIALARVDNYESNMFVKADYDINSKDPRVQYVFASDTIMVPLVDLWLNINTSFNSEGGVTLKNGQKPETLLKNIILSLSNKNDIVLDAYFGTGTTGAVAMKLGRKFIGIEQLDSHFEKAITRLTNVINGDQTGISKEVGWMGGGSFASFELKKLNQSLVDEIEVATEQNIDSIFAKVVESPFLVYKIKIKDIIDNKSSFDELTLDEKKKFLIEILDKNMLYVNYSDIDDEDMHVTDEEKEFTKKFYGES